MRIKFISHFAVITIPWAYTVADTLLIMHLPIWSWKWAPSHPFYLHQLTLPCLQCDLNCEQFNWNTHIYIRVIQTFHFLAYFSCHYYHTFFPFFCLRFSNAQHTHIDRPSLSVCQPLAVVGSTKYIPLVQ